MAASLALNRPPAASSLPPSAVCPAMLLVCLDDVSGEDVPCSLPAAVFQPVSPPRQGRGGPSPPPGGLGLRSLARRRLPIPSVPICSESGRARLLCLLLLRHVHQPRNRLRPGHAVARASQRTAEPVPGPPGSPRAPARSGRPVLLAVARRQARSGVEGAQPAERQSIESKGLVNTLCHAP